MGRRVILNKPMQINNPVAVSIGNLTTLAAGSILADLKPDQGRYPKIRIGTCCTFLCRFQCNAAESVVIGDYYPSLDEEARNGIGTIYSGHPAKDPETILEVLGMLKNRFPNVPQYIFGKFPRPEKIPRKSYTNFPSVCAARILYSRSLIWIMASCSEGFSLPILEAMACGCAVVATDCGGPRDIIVDGENGFIVKVGDIDGIVRRVEQLLNDQILRERLVRKSQETVNSFSWENSIGKLEEVLLEISEK